LEGSPSGTGGVPSAPGIPSAPSSGP
jgi:hypothetical protein